MKNRILLKEIPSGKFHSALFTTYSINLYYLEQQVLPLLGSKDIHYISILTDSNMLSAQLEAYSSLSQQKKRNYAIHGIQSNGSFHPKIIFLAGPDSLLLLLGSGNLTSSGHGKNLEVWNPIYIDNPEDKKLGFVLQAWEYLKEIHADLGDSAQNKIKSIEENCILLSNPSNIEFSTVYEINNNSSISFLSTQPEKSIFNQLSEIIGDKKIERITIMSPFYDVKGNFLHALNQRFRPGDINIILQKNFGAPPYNIKPKRNMLFFDWSEIQKEKSGQKYFHAKNMVFDGKKVSYLVSGSANASLAAFGTQQMPGINHESCIVYQNKSNSFIDILGIDLKKSKVNLGDYKDIPNNEKNQNEGQKLLVFIKSAEKNFDEVSVVLSSKKNIADARICLFDPNSKQQFEKNVVIDKGDSVVKLSIPYGITLMYAELFAKSKKISNKQFIIDIKAFEGTNPSPRNRSLNQIRKLIESGNFSTPKIIDYLNTIYKQRVIKKGTSFIDSSPDERKEILSPEEENDLLYLSYAEIQEKAKQLNDIQRPNNYIEYKGVRLWDSIFSYLKESREKEIQAKIDEEETEDINKASGRAENNYRKSKTPISTSTHQRLIDKVEKFLADYWDILESKINDKNSDKPSLIDLSMFLIMLEILLHLVSHKEIIEGEKNEEYLLHIKFSTRICSWSEYLIQFIGMFTLWCNQKGGFKSFDTMEYKLKLSLYQKMAFKTSISSLAIFSLINKNYDQNKITEWLKLSLLNSNHTFNPDNIKYKDTEEFIEFVPTKELEEFGEEVLTEEIATNLNTIYKHQQKKNSFFVGDTFLHPEDGFALINKIAINNTNTFYKLIHIAYDWDEKLEDFWNCKLYHVNGKRWNSAKK